MKTLKVLLRRSLAIALLSLPTEALPGEDRRIALALDNGPLGGTNQALLEELERLNIKATLLPENSDSGKFPQQPRAIGDANRPLDKPGHPHSGLLEMSSPAAGREVAGAITILRELGYRDPLTLHPPFRLVPQALEQPAEDESAHMDFLSDGNFDREDPEAVAEYLADNAFPGAVVLLHPMYGLRKQLLSALPLISERLSAEGYQFVTLSELRND